MATIRKRGPRQWEARIRKRGHPVQCKTFETKVLADAWARLIESEIDRGVFVSRAEAESTTLSDALDRYIREYIPRLADTKREEDRAWAIQRRAISSKFLAGIRGGDMAEFIREREAEGRGGQHHPPRPGAPLQALRGGQNGLGHGKPVQPPSAT